MKEHWNVEALIKWVVSLAAYILVFRLLIFKLCSYSLLHMWISQLNEFTGVLKCYSKQEL